MLNASIDATIQYTTNVWKSLQKNPRNEKMKTSLQTLSENQCLRVQLRLSMDNKFISGIG